MSLFLYLLAGLFILAGIAGSIIPVLPGPVLGFLGILVLYLSKADYISLNVLLVFGFFTALITVLDYIIPVYGTRIFRGSKFGIWGCTLGAFFGLFYPPFGFIIGPLIGAFVGETLTGSGFKTAFRSSLGAFLGFLAGTGLKLILTLYMAYYYGKFLIKILA